MLQLKNINYSVYNITENKNILKNVNLNFDYGKIYVITGHNGSGKSTLVKTIMGMILPASGSVLLNNTDITKCSISDRANLGIAFAFQQPVRFKGLTVKNLLDTASRNENKISDMCEYLSQVGLCARNYINREMDSSLSGGELKRIEIACTLARNCKINLFDEPEAGIDLWSFNGLVDIFKKLKNENNITIIVSHQEKILEIADTIILLNDGEVEKIGSKNELMPYLKNSRVCTKLEGGSNE